LLQITLEAFKKFGCLDFWKYKNDDNFDTC